MKLAIKTDALKELVARAVKGVGNNKLIPLTSLMCLEVKDGVFTITTTDASNYLYVRTKMADTEDFYTVVPVEVFSKLVARTTSETVVLTMSGSVLQVKGNGTYNIELPVDEQGDCVKYPNPLLEVKLEGESNKISSSIIRVLLNSIKPALATTLELPCYTGYYIGDKVVGTDTYKIACMNEKLVDTPVLMAAETVNLLAVMTADSVNMDILDDAVVFTSPDCCIYSSKMPGIEDYSIDAILGLVETEFDSKCEIPKAALLQVLDRLSLFVSPYDKNGIKLEFTDKELHISSKTSTGAEVIPYMKSENATEFACMIDIEFFTTQIKAQTGEVVNLFYGEENSIKMVDGNLTQIVALMEDDDTL